MSEALREHETLPDDVRRAADALGIRMAGIRRILTAPCCLPEQRRRAKDDLKTLAKESMALWSIL